MHTPFSHLASARPNAYIAGVPTDAQITFRPRTRTGLPPSGVGNRIVTMPVAGSRDGLGEYQMTAMRAALLSFMMLSAILVSGMGLYAAGATGGKAVNGYGVTAAGR